MSSNDHPCERESFHASHREQRTVNMDQLEPFPRERSGTTQPGPSSHQTIDPDFESYGDEMQSGKAYPRGEEDAANPKRKGRGLARHENNKENERSEN